MLSACGGGRAAPEWPIYLDGDGFARFLSEIQTEAEPWTEGERTEYLSYLRPEEFDHTFTVEEIKGLLEYREAADSVTAAQARQHQQQSKAGIQEGHFRTEADAVAWIEKLLK